jgi:L-asparaginase
LKKKVFIIYTGGTIGMMQDHQTHALVPIDFKGISRQIPELKNLNCSIDFHSSNEPIDSSNVHPELWNNLAGIIKTKYRHYDGFIILHGTDTMAYTASALSYMLKNLAKPVVLTGSQLPLGVIRTDAKRNLITTVEIVAAKQVVPEVCIYFNSRLFRGNRAEKFTSSQFDAFHSLNYPLLAEAGVNIDYDLKAIRKKPAGKFSVVTGFDTNVVLVKIFPGMSPAVISSIASLKGLKGIILETFGSGNAPSDSRFLNNIENAIRKGIVVMNISQCSGGAVDQGKYETSVGLKKLGVISGGDMTTEAAVTKMMFLLNKRHSPKKLKSLLMKNLSGERMEKQ